VGHLASDPNEHVTKLKYIGMTLTN
jgi:hypothetical protein